jgi:acyl-CoA synthetase (AMP-forming)/AMP-acid ligase II
VRRFVEQELGRDLAHLTIRVIDEMPMTPTGKISKAQLLDAAPA